MITKRKYLKEDFMRVKEKIIDKLESVSDYTYLRWIYYLAYAVQVYFFIVLRQIWQLYQCNIS